MTAPATPLVIRPATPDDAEAMIAHVHAMAVEAPDSLPIQPGEFQMTVDEEREFLSKAAASENSAFLVAEMEGRIVGVLNYTGGHRQAIRHAARLGISVRKSHQKQGIGSAMLAEAIRRAKATSCLRRLDLLVYFDNQHAIRLYERHGFVREGVHRRAVRRRDELIDEVHMALLW